MFTDPFLHKLEILHKACSAPKRWLHLNRYARFHAAIRTGLQITDQKKMDEAVHLALFAINYPQFPDGVLLAGEEPDFILSSGNRMIGIEHSRVFVQHTGKASLKGQEVIRDRIVEKAHKLYDGSNNPPVMISCTFNSDTSYRDRDIDTLSHQLAGSIPASLAKQNEWTPLEGHDAVSPWIPGMMFILGRAPEVYEPLEGRWGVSHGGIGNSSEPFIQTALDSKERKLKRYRKCDEFWALLVVEDFAGSGLMREPRPKHVFTSSFDRVFVYQLSKEVVTEVQCRH